MDEFIKATPSQKKIKEHLENLKPFERIEIHADQYGRPDTFLVIRQIKIIISAGEEKYIK